MPVFVYYTDDYPDNGGVGFTEFADRDLALNFINARLNRSEKPDINNYIVIEGKLLTLEAVQVVQKAAFAEG